tara:strand:+ start:294 stop:530 length:237 start_codon:yes stop_codon:yes gene_type:complete
MTEPKHKIWKTAATLNDYDSAVTLKENLLEKYTLVKIKRGYPDIYRIKVWDPPEEKEVKKKSGRRSKKDGKNNKKVHN